MVPLNPVVVRCAPYRFRADSLFRFCYLPSVYLVHSPLLLQPSSHDHHGDLARSAWRLRSAARGGPHARRRQPWR